MPNHIALVRGSPLLRALLVLLAITACGVGLAKLTGARPAARPPAAPPPPATVAGIEVPFNLVLSHPARSIRLDPGIDGAALDLGSGSAHLSGEITIDPANPLIFIDIEWTDPQAPGIHRFAKLTLEPPKQATLTRTFDSTGPLSDVWEIPSSVSSHQSSEKGMN